MQCRGFQKHFSAYLDETLEGRKRESVERHLRGCAACRADVQSLRQTVSLLREMEVEGPPAHVRAALAQKIRCVRQPMTRLEALRLQWSPDRIVYQARSWAFGLAASILLFSAGVLTTQYWNAPGVQLGLGAGSGPEATPPAAVAPGNRAAPAYPDHGAPPGPDVIRPPVSTSPTAGLRMWATVASALAVDQQGLLSVSLEPQQGLSDVQVLVYADPGVTLSGNVAQQRDASYLLHHGPLVRPQWLRVWVSADAPGEYRLRVSVRRGGRRLAETPLWVRVGQPF